MRRTQLNFILIFLLPLLAAAQGVNVSNSGSVAAPFLTISLDPRGTAMGNTATANAGGIQAVIWNPAVLSEDRNSFFIAHSNWLADISIEQAGFNFSLGNAGNIAVYITALNYGEMDVRTVIRPEGTGERFEASDFSFGLYYARDLTDRLKLGLGAKYIQQTIWHTSASTIAFDIGTLFHSPIWDIDFGVSISNFGTNLQLSGRDARVYHDIDPVMTGNNDRIPAQLELDPWPLPLLMRAGIQREFVIGTSHSFIVAADVFYPQDNYESVNAGIEYGYRKMFYLRAGYRGFFLENNEGGLSAGVGYTYRSDNLSLGIDVAYADYGILNNINIIALTIGWR